MNKFMAKLIQFYKRNEKLFERQLLKWHSHFADKEIERQLEAKALITRNQGALERVIGER